MVEKVIERIIFLSRWIMAPIYVGLLVGLLVLAFKFFNELWHFILHAPAATEQDVILGILALIDLSLTSSLVLIVVFSGYENFVSKIETEGHEDWPEWMTKIDFAGLKQKLLASIVAISAIQILKAFMNLDKAVDSTKLGWLVGIHMVFVLSGLLLAWTDKLSGDHHSDDAGKARNNGH